jgi:hypothetical protein
MTKDILLVSMILFCFGASPTRPTSPPATQAAPQPSAAELQRVIDALRTDNAKLATENANLRLLLAKESAELEHKATTPHKLTQTDVSNALTKAKTKDEARAIIGKLGGGSLVLAKEQPKGDSCLTWVARFQEVIADGGDGVTPVPFDLYIYSDVDDEIIRFALYPTPRQAR